MNRSKVASRLSAYLEGDLSEREVRRIEAALSEDPALREELRELESVVSLLRGLPDPEAPAQLATRVMARVQEERERVRGPIAWLGRLTEPVFAVPLATGIIALSLFVGSQRAELAEGVQVARLERPVPEQQVLAPVAPQPETVAATERPEAELAGVTNPIPEAGVRPELTPDQLRLAKLEDLPDPAVAPMNQDERDNVLAELQRRMIERHPNSAAELVAALRGAGHPHAASLAAHIEDFGFSNLRLASFQQPIRRR